MEWKYSPVIKNSSAYSRDDRKRMLARLWSDVTKVVHEVSETGSNPNVMLIMNDCKLKKKRFPKIFKITFKEDRNSAWFCTEQYLIFTLKNY